MNFMNIEIEEKYRHIGYPGIETHFETQVESAQNLALTIKLLTSIQYHATTLLGGQVADGYIHESDHEDEEENEEEVESFLGKLCCFSRSRSKRLAKRAKKQLHDRIRKKWYDAAEALRDSIYVNSDLSQKMMAKKTIGIIDEMYEFSEYCEYSRKKLSSYSAWLGDYELDKMRNAAPRMIRIVKRLVPIQDRRVAKLRR